MSGDMIRQCCLNGDSDALKNIIIGKANPCSSDAYGLTGLMYAVWNGHVDCVKWLICNTMGVDKNGTRCCSLNLASVKGYTALHLAALDCPKWSVEEIVLLLLIAGADINMKCNDGYTPVDLCRNEGNDVVFNIFNKYINSEDMKYLSSIQEMKEKLYKEYKIKENEELNWEVKDNMKLQFKMPKFMNERQRTGYMPEGMQIFEHQILPLVEEGFSEMKGSNALHCIDFGITQANINKDRREKLIKASDPNWNPLVQEDFDRLEQDKKKKTSRRRQRKESDDAL